jgi:hypothetical protein
MSRAQLISLVALALAALPAAGCDDDSGSDDPCANARTHNGEDYGTLVIEGPAQLEELADVNVFQGDLLIGNTSITNVDQLACLEVVTGQLSIQDNHALTNLDGLARLTEVGWGVSIYQNVQLSQLDGLASLASIGRGAVEAGLSDSGTLNITYNDTLSSIAGLASLSYLGGDSLRVSSNPLLPNCQAEQLAEQLEAAGWSGTTDFSGNDDTATCDE